MSGINVWELTKNMDNKTLNRFTAKLSQQKLALHYYPDQVLRKNAHPVHTFDKALRDFAHKMYTFMQMSRGIGLAAPQVGLLYRVITMDAPGMDKFLINPEIIAFSFDDDVDEEGCLSLPGELYALSRPCQIEVQARSPEGKKLHFETKGLNARIIQHEVDHLNGVLICDKKLDQNQINYR